MLWLVNFATVFYYTASLWNVQMYFRLLLLSARLFWNLLADQQKYPSSLEGCIWWTPPSAYSNSSVKSKNIANLVEGVFHRVSTIVSPWEYVVAMYESFELVLDFQEVNCDWQIISMSQKLFSGLSLQMLLFGRRKATTGNMSAFTGHYTAC